MEAFVTELPERKSMRYNEPSPLEVRAISQRFDLPNSASIDTYLANEGYVAMKKVLEHDPGSHHGGVEGIGSARPWRCGIPDRNEMEFRPAQHGKTDLYRLQLG